MLDVGEQTITESEDTVVEPSGEIHVRGEERSDFEPEKEEARTFSLVRLDIGGGDTRLNDLGEGVATVHIVVALDSGSVVVEIEVALAEDGLEIQITAQDVRESILFISFGCRETTKDHLLNAQAVVAVDDDGSSSSSVDTSSSRALMDLLLKLLDLAAELFVLRDVLLKTQTGLVAFVLDVGVTIAPLSDFAAEFLILDENIIVFLVRDTCASSVALEIGDFSFQLGDVTLGLAEGGGISVTRLMVEAISLFDDDRFETSEFVVLDLVHIGEDGGVVEVHRIGEGSGLAEPANLLRVELVGLCLREDGDTEETEVALVDTGGSDVELASGGVVGEDTDVEGSAGTHVGAHDDFSSGLANLLVVCFVADGDGVLQHGGDDGVGLHVINGAAVGKDACAAIAEDEIVTVVKAESQLVDVGDASRKLDLENPIKVMSKFRMILLILCDAIAIFGSDSGRTAQEAEIGVADVDEKFLLRRHILCLDEDLLFNDNFFQI